MQILLCAATEPEIKLTVDWIRENKINDIEVLITGVGMLQATHAITKAVIHFKPQLVLQAGIGGSLSTHFSIGDVVAIKNECIGDVGVEEHKKFRSAFDLALINENHFPWSKGRLVNTNQLLSGVGLPIANGVTVNQITTHAARIDYYNKSLGSDVESMEGAALHYVCLMEKISFLQIRAISNFAGERDKANWKIESSISKLNQVIQSILSNQLLV